MVKKLAWYAFLIVVALWVINDPAGASNLAHQAFQGLGHAASSLSTIASNL
ncbi:MAG TPA: hypothetical protein VGH27_03835 [Streptosporangiaceae bacterium]|jgi:hypothetical protein